MFEKGLCSLRVFRALLKKGADLVTPSILHQALEEGRFDIADEILANGFRINDRFGTGGSTILHWQCSIPHNCHGRHSNRDPFAIRWLIEKGADVNQVDLKNWTPIQYAIFPPGVSLEVISILAKSGANLCLFYNSGLGLVEMAEDSKQTDVANLLISLGAPRISDGTRLNEAISELSRSLNQNDV